MTATFWTVTFHLVSLSKYRLNHEYIPKKYLMNYCMIFRNPENWTKIQDSISSIKFTLKLSTWRLYNAGNWIRVPTKPFFGTKIRPAFWTIVVFIYFFLKFFDYCFFELFEYELEILNDFGNSNEDMMSLIAMSVVVQRICILKKWNRS